MRRQVDRVCLEGMVNVDSFVRRKEKHTRVKRLKVNTPGINLMDNSWIITNESLTEYQLRLTSTASETSGD